jgi:hemerythrin
MIEYSYPDYHRHREYHESFKTTVRSLTDELMAKGPTDLLIGQVHMSVAEWLINHIRSEDFKLAAYVKANPHQ